MKELTKHHFLSQKGFLTDVVYPSMLRGGGDTQRKVILPRIKLSGIASAHELTRMGYKCTTLARGTKWKTYFPVSKGLTTEADIEKATHRLGEGRYYHAGPFRIPPHHLIMRNGKGLGVALEVYNYINESAYFFTDRPGIVIKPKNEEAGSTLRYAGYMASVSIKPLCNKPDTTPTKENAENLRIPGGRRRLSI